MNPLYRHCREVGLQRLDEVDEHRASPDRIQEPWILKVGTGYAKRTVSVEGPSRLARWRSIGDAQADVTADDAANQIVHHFGSPKGDRTPLRSPQTVSAADETAVSTRQLQPPSSFTAVLEPDPAPIQGQLFDLAENGQP